MIQYKNFFIVILLLAAGFSAFMIVVVNIHKTISPNNKSALNGFMTGVTAIKMDKTGFPKTVLTAPLFQYFRDKEAVLITDPKLKINPHNTHIGNWFISANKAIAFLSNNTIHLYDKVRIFRSKTKNLPQTTFLTASLTVDPNNNKASTSKTVTILQPKNNLTSKGLRANLKTGVISLVSQASGEFDPDIN